MATGTDPGTHPADEGAQAKVREQLDQRSAQLAEQAQQQASDLKSVSAALRDQGKDRPAQAVDRLAGYAEQAANYLRDTGADSMLADAEDLGRRKPGAVAAGALAVGLAASRFLKASSGRRYSAGHAQQSREPTHAASVEQGPVEQGPVEPLPVAPLPVAASTQPSPRPGI
jgi:hypothetical protein